jgi:hypothetical protein
VRQGEGLNFGEQGGAAKLDVAMNPIGGAKLSALKCLASPGHRLSEPFCLNLFEEAPHADPHVGCCGDGEGKPPCYPIMQCYLKLGFRAVSF